MNNREWTNQMARTLRDYFAKATPEQVEKDFLAANPHLDCQSDSTAMEYDADEIYAEAGITFDDDDDSIGPLSQAIHLECDESDLEIFDGDVREWLLDKTIPSSRQGETTFSFGFSMPASSTTEHDVIVQNQWNNTKIDFASTKNAADKCYTNSQPSEDLAA